MNKELEEEIERMKTKAFLEDGLNEAYQRGKADGERGVVRSIVWLIVGGIAIWGFLWLLWHTQTWVDGQGFW